MQTPDSATAAPSDRKSRRHFWILCLVGVVLIIGYQGKRLTTRIGEARKRAEIIGCMSNLKQITYAAKIYATDHDKRLPGSFAKMQRELGTFRLLVCRLDRSNPIHKATNWAQVNVAASSYELLAAGTEDDDEFPKPFVRCKLHGFICDTRPEVHSRE